MYKIKFHFLFTGFTLGILLTVGMFNLLPAARKSAQATVGDVVIDQSVAGTFTALDMVAQKLSDSANTAYFIDPAASGNSLVTAGDATVSGNIALGNTKTIRSAFGPLSLQYKSGLDSWSTGLTLQDTTGNVGIGTTTPASLLTVAGVIESTTGGVKFPDATTQTTAYTGGGETAGQIAFFTTTCPSGWTEYTAARGMYIVGNPLSGTLATAVGTALTNLENRPVGQHLHSVDPASTSVGISDPGHAHTVPYNHRNDSGGGEGDMGRDTGTSKTTSSSTTGISASVDIAAFNSANAGSVAGTNAPYIQLTACQKS